MTLFAGRHRFPDANHRTAMSAFSTATLWAWRLVLTFNKTDSESMVKGSKKLRDEHKRKTGAYFSLPELQQPTHQYRQHFANYETKIQKLDYDDFLPRLAETIEELRIHQKGEASKGNLAHAAEVQTQLAQLESGMAELQASEETLRQSLIKRGRPPRVPRA